MSKSFSAFALILAAILLTAGNRPALAAAPARALITAPIDEERLVTLSGNTRSAARIAGNDRGPVSDDLPLEHMLLLLKRPSETQAALDTLLEQLHNPAAAQYHQWLTAAQFAGRFGSAPADVDAVTDWLARHGFTVNRIQAGGALIDFSGNAGQLREAFHTELHQLDIQGEAHIANVSDPRLPAALAPAILGIASLNDFHPHAMSRSVAAAHIAPRGGELISADDAGARNNYTLTAGNETYQAVTPGDLATIYNLNPLFAGGRTGQGQTIAVIENSDLYSTADWTSFRSAFGLAKYNGRLSQVHPGGCTDPGVAYSDGEAILDAEYASAAAPGATVQVTSCADSATTFGGLLALEGLINSGSAPPSIVSISFGECEAENGAAANATYNAVYQQAVAEGVSIFVSAGDEGAAGCDIGATAASHGTAVNAFAATAYNVAVGGTDFGDTYAADNSAYWNSANDSALTSARSYVNEIPWNDSCASSLLARYIGGSSASYGDSGFCNSAVGQEYYQSVTAGSGGASSCASGVPSLAGVTSGTCQGTAKPSWQKGVPGIPSDNVRDLPDLSLFAGNGVWGHYYVYCFSDAAHGGLPCTGAPSGWSGGGGTSFSSPILAGIQALVNQQNGGAQGNPNPVYYRLAAAEYTSSRASSCNSSKGRNVAGNCTFYDITEGDNDVACTAGQDCYRPQGSTGVLSTTGSAAHSAYAAAAGYDLATGLGTLNAYNLVHSWSTQQTLPERTLIRAIR